MRVQKTGRPDYRPDGSQGWGSGICPPLQGDYLMSITIGPPQVDELKPRIAVLAVGGAGGNAIANLIAAGVPGGAIVVDHPPAQTRNPSPAERRLSHATTTDQGMSRG